MSSGTGQWYGHTEYMLVRDWIRTGGLIPVEWAVLKAAMTGQAILHIVLFVQKNPCGGCKMAMGLFLNWLYGSFVVGLHIIPIVSCTCHTFGVSLSIYTYRDEDAQKAAYGEYPNANFDQAPVQTIDDVGLSFYDWRGAHDPGEPGTAIGTIPIQAYFIKIFWQNVGKIHL
ncbi:MAG: hypothetical protein H0U76_09605 [Ktedonobacteraceae bacterium]|nr:hypothetical protein [Ktedonobacteraceae bacterium]